MVSTAQTGSTQRTGVHAVYHIFGPAVSVSTSPLQARGAGVVSAVCRPSAFTAIHHRGEGVVGVMRGPSEPTVIHNLSRPAMSVSSAQRADHRHSPPYTTGVMVPSARCGDHRYPPPSTTLFHRQTPPLQARDRQHPKKKNARAPSITVYDIPRVAPYIAAIVQRRHSRRHLR